MNADPARRTRPRSAPPKIAVAPNLRRVPIADGLNPTGLPPGVQWAQRATHLIAEGQYRIVVPCVLACRTVEGVHGPLTDELRRSWVGVDARRPWQITSVAAAFDSHPGRVAMLTLAVSASPLTSVPTLGPDDDRMARDVNAALVRAIGTTE